MVCQEPHDIALSMRCKASELMATALRERSLRQLAAVVGARYAIEMKHCVSVVDLVGTITYCGPQTPVSAYRHEAAEEPSSVSGSGSKPLCRSILAMLRGTRGMLGTA